MAEAQKAPVTDFAKRHPLLQRMKRRAERLRHFAGVALLAGLVVSGCGSKTDKIPTDEKEKIQEMNQVELSDQKEKYRLMQQELTVKLEEKEKELYEVNARKDSIQGKINPVLDSLNRKAVWIDREIAQKETTIDSLDNLSLLQIKMAEKNGTFDKLANLRTRSDKDIEKLGYEKGTLLEHAKEIQNDSTLASLKENGEGISKENREIREKIKGTEQAVELISGREGKLASQKPIRWLSGILAGIGLIGGIGLVKEGVARNNHYDEGNAFIGFGIVALGMTAGLLIGGLWAATWLGFGLGAGAGLVLGAIVCGAVFDA